MEPVVEVSKTNKAGNSTIEEAIHDEIHNRTEYDLSFDHKRDFDDCNGYCQDEQMYQQECEQHMEIQDSFIGPQKEGQSGRPPPIESLQHDELTTKSHREDSTFGHEQPTKGKR